METVTAAEFIALLVHNALFVTNITRSNIDLLNRTEILT
jgi:hypothetical protein